MSHFFSKFIKKVKPINNPERKLIVSKIKHLEKEYEKHMPKNELTDMLNLLALFGGNHIMLSPLPEADTDQARNKRLEIAQEIEHLKRHLQELDEPEVTLANSVLN